MKYMMDLVIDIPGMVIGRNLKLERGKHCRTSCC